MPSLLKGTFSNSLNNKARRSLARPCLSILLFVYLACGAQVAITRFPCPTYLRQKGKIDIPQANNVVEALHKKFKNEFLQGKKFANHEGLVTALPNLIGAYNNQYHDSLYGYSPLEVWNGAMPDKNKYRTLLANANEHRKQTNKQFNCCTNIRTF